MHYILLPGRTRRLWEEDARGAGGIYASHYTRLTIYKPGRIHMHIPINLCAHD